jgi:tripartite-type tricarboxylate transporter receptor subunit TctC
MNRIAAFVAALALFASCAAGTIADPIADFYRGKTIRMLIGYGPGGGYDLYARLVAEFLPRHLPGNPTILPELAASDEGRAILRAIAGTAEIGRSVIAGPDVPADRLAALRTAFADMLKDADFLAACDQRHFMVDAGTGEEMDAITRETFALSPEVRAKIGAMLNAM